MYFFRTACWYVIPVTWVFIWPATVHHWMLNLWVDGNAFDVVLINLVREVLLLTGTAKCQKVEYLLNQVISRQARMGLMTIAERGLQMDLIHTPYLDQKIVPQVLGMQEMGHYVIRNYLETKTKQEEGWPRRTRSRTQPRQQTQYLILNVFCPFYLLIYILIRVVCLTTGRIMNLMQTFPTCQLGILVELKNILQIMALLKIFVKSSLIRFETIFL